MSAPPRRAIFRSPCGEEKQDGHAAQLRNVLSLLPTTHAAHGALVDSAEAGKPHPGPAQSLTFRYPDEG